MSVWLVRLSLGHLVAGSTLGAFLLAAKGVVPAVPSGALPAIHREVMLFGWIVQFVLGVGFWILGPARAVRVRGLAWWVLGLLNAGVALSIAAAVVAAVAVPLPGVLRTVGLVARVLEAAAILIFLVPIARRGLP